MKKGVFLSLFSVLMMLLGACGEKKIYQGDVLNEQKIKSAFKVTATNEIIGIDWDHTTQTIYQKVGEVKRMFVGHISDAHYNNGKADKVTFTVQKSASEIEAISTSSMKGYVFDLSANVTATLPINLPKIDIFGAKAMLGLNLEYSQYDISKINTYSMRENVSLVGWQRELDFSEYQPGYFYSIGLFRDYDVYQKTIVNSSSDTIESISYIYAISSEVDGIEVIQSKKESLSFEVKNDIKIKPSMYSKDNFITYLNKYRNRFLYDYYFSTTRPELNKPSLNLDMSFSKRELLNDFTTELNQGVNYSLAKYLGQRTLYLNVLVDLEVDGQVEVEIEVEVSSSLATLSQVTKSTFDAGPKTMRLSLAFYLTQLTDESTYKMYVRVRKTTLLIGDLKFLSTNRFSIYYL